MKKIFVTGSCGLIGSEVCTFFGRRGFEVHGLDNNQRAKFFGSRGDTIWNRNLIFEQVKGYQHYDMDIRQRECLLDLVKNIQPSLVVHAAGQPSHDLAAKIPFDDFDTNAVGTMNLLEACRGGSPEAPFIFLSTNKVYGSKPNTIRMKELETRWDYDDPYYEHGVAEEMSIDQSTHSLFGASKVAADIMVQEYGKYFGMPTCCLRGGCLTGAGHSGVELHGFLSYLVRTIMEEVPYHIYGYKGKQVRDNIHSEDVAEFMECFFQSPRCGEVYNMGGGKENSCSVLEAIQIVESLTGKKHVGDLLESSRTGDHICYYSDLRKAQRHFPEWKITRSLSNIFQELVEGWNSRLQ